MKLRNYIRVVLVEPTHPGNIGAAARAMGNMGVSDLVLVNPATFPSPIANARASGADHILEAATVCNAIDQALESCTLVFGTTARDRSIEWPAMTPWQAMQAAKQRLSDSAVAIVFGRERSGLTNDELDRCHHLVRIPVDDDFASLNLGSAVTVMLYEFRKTMLDQSAEPQIEQPALASADMSNFASADELRGFYDHMESVLHEIEFIDGRSSNLMRKIIRLFNRAYPTREEINILRGILSSVEYQNRKTKH